MNNVSGITVVAIQDRVPYDIYIGRAFGGFAASIWANPYKVGRDGTGAEVLAKYEARVRNNPELMSKLLTLQNARLACWCKTKKNPNAPCHGDVLAKLVSEAIEQAMRYANIKTAWQQLREAELLSHQARQQLCLLGVQHARIDACLEEVNTYDPSENCTDDCAARYLAGNENECTCKESNFYRKDRK